MSLFSALLAIVLVWTPTWYPPGKGPESVSAREARWTMVTRVIVEASNEGITELWPNDEASLVATVWRFESGSLDYHVHGGEPSPIGNSDDGQSRCLGQIQHVEAWWTEAEWMALAGRDYAATKRCARATLRVIRYHMVRCKLRRDVPKYRRWKAPLTFEEAAILFNAYGSGLSCKPGRAERVKFWGRLRAKLPP